MAVECCRTCKAFVDEECHRHAPRCMQEFQIDWAQVWETDWCCEYLPKKETVNASTGKADSSQ
jgi:hypothetical protein